MTPRRADIQDRKERILGIVVNEYIRTINPVSSGYIVEKYKIDLSSATVRNILGELESDGYLTHPHTSAGRIPTEDGYRYYVDHLMYEIALLEEQKQRIKMECERERQNLERILEKTSRMISDLTHCTSIVTIEGPEGKFFCTGTRYVVEFLECSDLQKIKEILALLEEKEKLLELINCNLRKKMEIFIGHEIEGCNIVDCSMAVSAYRLHNGQGGRIAILGPKRMNYGKVVSALDYVCELMHDLF
ncbi:MAG: hypothetical protein AB1650_02470 [Candidatus Omnitrophota bacterium]